MSDDRFPYKEFGTLLGNLRLSAGFAKQQDLAAHLGVKQQTISRWEQGLSRPRAKDVATLAQALGVDEAILSAQAGHASVVPAIPAAGTAFDRPLPLHALTPEGFERFCRFLLERLYRGRGDVRAYGGPGHKQDGIDILVTDAIGVHTYQCKRVEKFGAQKVHAAVATQTYQADQKVLLLSSTASPDARDAIAMHPGWQLWDREDISQRLRSLSMQDQIDLVDIFFRGHRFDLLGLDEAGPLQAEEEFFKPFLADDRLFNHSWELVGREDEVDAVAQHLLDAAVVLTLLVGGPGYGKTRLLREVVTRLASAQPGWQIRFVSQTEEVKAKHLELLGDSPLLLIVDDAHDRDDLGVLLRFAAANAQKQVRLLFSLRPYGKNALKHQAATFSLTTPEVREVCLEPLDKGQAKALAERVLDQLGGPTAQAQAVAEATFGSPLATVLGAQIVARDKIAPVLMSNAGDFQDHVLARLQDVIAGKIVAGQDAVRLQAVLRIAALVQPIVPDDPNLLDLLLQVEGVERADAARLLRLLIDAGILFKRGRRYRIAPDLLADSIIQSNYVGPEGSANERSVAVFERAAPEQLRNLLVNLGRLEWRLRDGQTEGGRILASVASKLEWRDDYVNAHVVAVEAVAYYQPRFALDFAARLIREGHGDDASVRRMLRNAAFTMTYLEEACALLWRASKADSRTLNSHPDHGIRILKELAEFEPNKPIECVRVVVRFALSLLDRPHSLEGPYTPFSILEGALGTEMESRAWTSREMTITRHQLPLPQVKQVRDEIVSSLIQYVGGGATRHGYLAAATLAEALRAPMHGRDRDAWDDEHRDVLQKLFTALTENEVHPLVVVRSAKSASWHAFYGPAATKPLAQRIISLLDRDLPTRVARALVDGWGGETYELKEPYDRSAIEFDRIALIEELKAGFTSVDDLTDFLNQYLNEISAISGKGLGSAFALINQLIVEIPGFASAILRRYKETKNAPLASYAGAALGHLMGSNEGRAQVKALLEEAETEETLVLIADAYSRYQPLGAYGEDDSELLRKCFESGAPAVLAIVPNIAQTVARLDPAFAVDLICSVNFELAGRATHDLFMWLLHESTIPKELLRNERYEQLLAKLVSIPSLDDYWIQEFLKKAILTVPDKVMHLIVSRLERASQIEGWSYRVLERSYMARHNGEGNPGLGFTQAAGWENRVRFLLDWALHSREAGEYSNFGEVFAALCGHYDDSLLDVLVQWLRQGPIIRARIVGDVLRCAQNTIIYDFPQFVRDILDVAETLGDEAVATIRSAFFSATISGVRGTTPGEPFPEDIRLRAHAQQALAKLSRADPAYDMFAEFLLVAEQGIERQRKEKEALDAEDEE
ncbi:helix-turn-helix domain-containing protein [Ralstonia sp.]|uniref:helix-turn-helix domain-containing protein n=1 Tax=Ralstonia sp. TaxID=54061 RepID=UPI0031CE1D64